MADATGASEQPLADILDAISDSDEDGRIAVNDVLAAFEARSTGVILTMLGLLAALPIIGAVPGMSITTGTLILLALAREVFGVGTLRMPGRLGRLSISQERFNKGAAAGRKLTDRVDRILRPRLTVLTTGVARGVILMAIAVLALTMFPLAFVPWGVTAPSFGIVAFGAALLARDGVFALAGYAFIAATVATALAVF